MWLSLTSPKTRKPSSTGQQHRLSESHPPLPASPDTSRRDTARSGTSLVQYTDTNGSRVGRAGALRRVLAPSLPLVSTVVAPARS